MTNADKIVVTGRKAEEKVYRYHTGWPGGLRTIPFDQMPPEKVEPIVRFLSFTS